MIWNEDFENSRTCEISEIVLRRCLQLAELHVLLIRHTGVSTGSGLLKAIAS